VFLLIYPIYQTPLQAQFLKDNTAQYLASQAIEKIYHFDFTSARTLIKKLELQLPNHPVIHFLYAYAISWEHFPLQKSYNEYGQYEFQLKKCLSTAEILLKKDKKSIEGNYFAMMAYSLMAMHEAESGDFMTAVGQGKSAFYYIKKGFDWGEKLSDYYFTTGLYRYYAAQYPETHPAAKAVMIFFPGGNKQQGLQYLHKAASESKFSKIESMIYLHSIYTKYEKNYLNALAQTQILIQNYPNNPFFALKHVESLIAVGRYGEAEWFFNRFSVRSSRIYKIAFHTFKGILYEKYYKDNDKAKEFYNASVNIKNADVRYSKDFQALAYAGLGRIYFQENKKNEAKKYLKTAQTMTEYEGLKEEIKVYLKRI
jgi:tetratricopeptide (TPR) repeat protein